MRVPVRLLTALLLPVMLAGCRQQEDVKAPTRTGEEPSELSKTEPMAEHFLQINAIRDAVIAGDLAATKEPSQWLIEHLVADDLPLRWRSHVPAIQRAAQAVHDAENVEAAAYAAAEAAAVCGQCHQDVEVELKPSTEPEPLKDDTQFAYMDRHAWGANRMWDGLVAPSDEEWQRGAKAFMEAPLHAEGASEELAKLADRVHGIAATAATQTEPADRAGHFAALIATCADCHTKAKAAASTP
jgi:hypothetical protein